MGGFLRQSTASQSRALGPFIDNTDFISPLTGLTIANTDVKLVVNGGASSNKNSGGGTHRVNGVYGFTFDATDTATVGEMEVNILVSGALIVFDKYQVLEEAVYDAFYAAAAPGYVVDQPVNVTKWLGTTVSTPTVAGVPNVNTKTWNDLATVALPLVPTTAGRTLDVTATGEAGIDWSNIGAPTTSVALTGTTISSSQVAASVTAPVTVGTNNDKTGYALSTAGVDLIWDDAVDGAVTARESLRLANSANGAITAGGATTTFTIRDLADTKDRVTATVDANGDRSAVTRDLT